MKRAALYARTSTGAQDAENQLSQLRTWAHARGFQIAAEYTDNAESGTTAAQNPQLRNLLADAHHRRFDIVLFWALDRLTREGARAAFRYLETLESYGIEYHSMTEPEVSSAGPFAHVFQALRAVVAKLEAERISARTRAGLARARAQGKQIGRPRRIVNLERAREMRAAGASLAEIAAALGISKATAGRITGRVSGNSCYAE